MSVGTHRTGGVELTGEHVSRALAMAQTNVERYSNDGDLDRSDDDWRSNVYQGALAEIAAEQYLTDRGFDARIVDDDDGQDHDLVVEGLTVEIKLRRLWNYRNPDLLLRFDEELSSDIYLMVEAERGMNGPVFEPTKWANKQTVARYLTDFRPDRPKVPRERLKDIGRLEQVLTLVRGGSQ